MSEPEAASLVRSLVSVQFPFLQEKEGPKPGMVGAHTGLYEGQMPNWLLEPRGQAPDHH